MAGKMPRLLKDTTSLVKLIAYIDIVVTSLLLFVVCIFTLTWLIAPESLHNFSDEADQEIATEIKDFSEIEGWKQWLILILLLSFWIVLLMVSIGLRYWTIKRDVKGLRVWLVVRAALIVITLPLDTIWLLRSGGGVTDEELARMIEQHPDLEGRDPHELKKELEDYQWAEIRNMLLFLIVIYSYLLFTMLVVFFYIRSVGRRQAAEGDHQIVEFHTQSTIVEREH